jgi:hypothetical protein
MRATASGVQQDAQLRYVLVGQFGGAGNDSLNERVDGRGRSAALACAFLALGRVGPIAGGGNFGHDGSEGLLASDAIWPQIIRWVPRAPRIEYPVIRTPGGHPGLAPYGRS